VTKADVAELVDARDLKSLDGNVVWVRVPPPAPSKIRHILNFRNRAAKATGKPCPQYVRKRAAQKKNPLIPCDRAMMMEARRA
jgi:hypothetical protein